MILTKKDLPKVFFHLFSQKKKVTKKNYIYILPPVSWVTKIIKELRKIILAKPFFPTCSYVIHTGEKTIQIRPRKWITRTPFFSLASQVFCKLGFMRTDGNNMHSLDYLNSYCIHKK